MYIMLPLLLKKCILLMYIYMEISGRIYSKLIFLNGGISYFYFLSSLFLFAKFLLLIGTTQ